MTNRELKIAVAEASGFSVPSCIVQDGWLADSIRYAHYPDLTLEWMHEVESKMNADEYCSYIDKLLWVTTGQSKFRHSYDYRACISATAEKRATAFCKMKGLWKE